MKVVRIFCLKDGHKVELSLTGEIDPLPDGYSRKSASGEFGEYTFCHFSTGRFVITEQIFRLSKATRFLLNYDCRGASIDFAHTGSVFIDAPFETLMAKGQFNFLFSGTTERIYQFEYAKSYKIFSIYFTLDYFSDFSDQYLMIARFLSRVAGNQSTLMSELHGLAGHKLQRSFLEIRAGMAQFPGILFFEAAVDNLLLLALEQLVVSCQQRHSDRKGRYESIYNAGEEFILEPDKRYSIQHMARKMNMNPNKLKSLFKKKFKMPPISFLTKMRMEKARQLLVDTNLPIQEISMLVGYNNPGHFSHVFRTKMGCTPKQMRKKQL